MTHALLSELLDQGSAHAPEYRGGLSNHLPMALLALQRLGADEPRLRDFAARYAQRLAPLPPTERHLPSLAQWPQCLGDLDACGALQELFAQALQRDGAPALLRAVLPRLMQGVGAAAFHGLIRAAYAVDGAHSGELAAGLAYWAGRYLPLAASLPAEGEHALMPWIDRLLAASRGFRSDAGLIFERMQQVAAIDAFAHDAGTLRVGPSTLQQLAAFAADRYLASRDFTVLHLLTSCHAMRLLLPHVGDAPLALRWYTLAFGAGFAASGVDPHRPAPDIEPLPWMAVSERARQSDNDHVIKLAYTCREQAQAYADDLYRRVATLAVTV
jgi:Questin oxidase-like